MQLKYIEPVINAALREDEVLNDITTKSVIHDKIKVKALFIVKENGIICGLSVIKEIFNITEKKYRIKKKDKVKFIVRVKDKNRVKKNQVIAEVYGLAGIILAAERSALNFLQRLSGIASLTDKYVRLTEPYNVKIYDTRKTTPGLRYLEKYAVKCGGGYNHRMSLRDMVLLKDNHLKLLDDKVLLGDLIRKIRKKIPEKIQIEVETESLGQIREALEAQADIIMLDNMNPKRLKEALDLIKVMKYNGKPLVEVSGGVNLNNIKTIARLGMDRISVGALTHSYEALDISLEVIR